MDQHRARGRKDGDQPGPGAKRGIGGKACGAGLRRTTGQNDRMAAIIFVAGIGGPLGNSAPQIRIVGESPRPNRLQDVWQNTDWPDRDLAAEAAPGLQAMTGFCAKEADRATGPEGRAEHRAAIARDAGGQIDG